MSDLKLSDTEILHGAWVVHGTQKVDAVIKMLCTAPTDVFVWTNDIGWLNKLKTALPKLSIGMYYEDEFLVEVNSVYVMRTPDKEHTQYLLDKLPTASGRFLLADYKEIDNVNCLSVMDGELLGVKRYKEVV